MVLISTMMLMAMALETTTPAMDRLRRGRATLPSIVKTIADLPSFVAWKSVATHRSRCAFNRAAIFVSASCQRRHAVVRSQPCSWLMSFQGTRAARFQTSLRSSSSIQSTQSKVRSSRVIAAAEGHTRIGSGSMNAISRLDRTISGQVLKYPCAFTGGSLRSVRNASSKCSATHSAVHSRSAMTRLPTHWARAVELLAELADQFTLGPGEAVVIGGDREDALFLPALALDLLG